MRLVVIALNIMLLVTALLMFVVKGLPARHDYYLVFIIIAAPLASLLAFFFSRSVKGGERWIGSIFKKKGVRREED